MVQEIRSCLLADVPHGFSTRAGLLVDAVAPGGVPILTKQIHSADVVRANGPFAEPPKGDALVTDRAGLVLGIITADCAPVIFVDIEAGVVGAAHAGWRGAHGGVIENTVAAMEGLGARRSCIRAAIGPCIAQGNYEVDEAMRQHFVTSDTVFFSASRPGHWQFDLPGFVAARLRMAGVGEIDDLGLDTYADPARFHSYRRASHRGEPSAGRQISLIALP